MFFYLSKVIWYFLQPSVLIVLAIIAGALLMRCARTQRMGWRLFVGGVAALVVFGLSPISYVLTSLLETRFVRPDLGSGPPVAGIIILGGGGFSAVPERLELANLNDAAERYTEGAALAHKLKSARVVFSGGSGGLIEGGASESTLARRLLVALGVEEQRLQLETASRTTFENAQLTKALVSPQPGSRWLLVTSAWHMPRAVGCFRKVGFEVEAWPVDYRAPKIEVEYVFLDGLRRTDMVFKEFAGLVAYYLTGRTNALLPAP